MKRLMLLSALAMAGCYTEETSQPQGIASFKVEVTGLTNAQGAPLPVVTACAVQYGSQAAVPAEVRGTEECRYIVPLVASDIALDITALDQKGQPLESFNGPVSFRVVPGNLSRGEYEYRWTTLTDGRGTGTVRAGQLYGKVNVWVQDEAPEVDYQNGVVVPGKLPTEPATRTLATGLSKPLMFEEPTIALVQTPQRGNDPTLTSSQKQLSAYNGTFMSIGRAPESGAVLRQNCVDGDPNANALMTLLVTGIDPGGFFVTDVTACRVRENGVPGANTQTAEPDGYFPGRFNSIYIYNYSFPEALDPGDLLWGVTGSVQEFTSTTQLTFPSWIVREHVRLLPQTEWDKYLKLVQPVEINNRLCGYGRSPYIADPLCGLSYINYKLESLESSLVKVRRVTFPRVFHNCDTNGDGQVPIFCQTLAGTWGGCGDEDSPNLDVTERQCNIDCAVGTGPFTGQLCTERNTFETFGQFSVAMNPTGAAEASLDASVPGRISRVTAEVTWKESSGFEPGQEVHVWCDKAANLRFGGITLPETDNVPLAARTLYAHTLRASEAFVWVSPQTPANGAVTCQVAMNARTRINVVTKDAAPDLVVDCREDDPDAERARQCRFLRGATFDITGHLRQVSAARPRWMVLPRDQDDLCCHPGPGLECPRPIKPCANP
ncbi:single stranded DNA-binding domain-containing protein [Pyxidicoccus xibeiensis]|uniref:hypothetical protein n=1 Tax=Pyxidicoccus xibeiensis TaxID=2906759 RepID=UPI0020A7C6F5|nr:hypothetical protein [Pyxidicoccus xibeiensis]MCP3141190.1 hypothetical protein [Pyxidicoccus xibeiensis]